MLIKGYAGYEGPLVAGESLLARPGFWSAYLLATCGEGSTADAPLVPEWFGDDGADTDACFEILFDPELWPVFRIPVAGGPGAVVIFRNLYGDYGTDYLLTPPDGSAAQLSATGLTWQEMVRIADDPSPAADGVEGSAARLLLLLPLLDDLDIPETAPARLGAALTAAGAPQQTAPHAAEHLLTRLMRRSRHDPTWGSPLSG